MRIRSAFPLLLLAAALAASSARADGLTVLTVDKVLSLKGSGGQLRVGKDPRLAQPPSPLCPTADGSRALHVSGADAAGGDRHHRDARLRQVALQAGRLRLQRSSRDGRGALGALRPLGPADPLRRQGIPERRLGRSATPRSGSPSAPRASTPASTTSSATTPTAIVSRKASEPAATGERAFWAVLHHDWQTTAGQGESRSHGARLLHPVVAGRQAGRPVALPARHDPPLPLRAGGRRATTAVSDFARGEIEAAHAAFEDAVPLLWDPATRRGDSRVPGFAAATTFGLGVVRNDPDAAGGRAWPRSTRPLPSTRSSTSSTTFR